MKKSKPSLRLGIGNTFTGEIEKLVFKGDGLTRIEGKVVFIPDVLPQEKILFEIVEEKKDYARGECKEVLFASPYRVSPKCVHFGECGGCQWQHIDYEMQVQVKQEWVEQGLTRISNQPIDFFPPIQSADPWNYRHRIQVHTRKDGTQGFVSRKGTCFPLQECPITHPQIMDSFHQEKKQWKPSEESRWEGTLLENSQVQWICGDQTERYFIQIHQSQNRCLQEKIKELVQSLEIKRDLLWDLFAGDGNLSFPLADQFKSILALEGSSTSIERGQTRAQEQNQSHIQFISCDLFTQEKFSNWFQSQNQRPDMILIDPPRKGCAELIKSLTQLEILNGVPILYISCHFSSLERDAKILLESGYHIKTAGILDMFPQTYHFETICMFS